MVFQPGEEGQGLAEYALILMFVALVVVTALTVLGPAIGNLYSKLYNKWPM